MTGQTFTSYSTTGLTISNLTYSMIPNSLSISKPGTNKELLFIKSNGEIFYNVNDEMVKVNCSEDIGEAFTYVVLGYSDSTPEEVLIDKYINKMLNNERSNEYITKLEKTFRKLKLEKIKNVL
jgi:hypothetical protein